MKNIFKNITPGRAVKAVLFCVLVYFPIFLHVDTLPIRLYDESRLALNAYEMQRDGNLLVAQYQRVPDMWNTKPPLMIWLQALNMKLFGVHELSVRLPSVLGAFFTTLLLLLLALRYLRDYWFGLVAVLMLVTSPGYIENHLARTGDYDTLLTFWVTAYAFLFFAFAETGRKKYLHWFFAVLCLAILTKSVQALLFAPALFLYLLFAGRMACLRTKWVIIDALIVTGVVALFYLSREHFNPGYLEAVWNNELGGRYFEVNEHHDEVFMFYYDMLMTSGFAPWFWLIPAGIFLGLFSKDDRVRRITILSTVIALSYWLIISNAKTKLYWYSAPLYPFISILAGIPVWYLIRLLFTSQQANEFFRVNITPYVMAFIIFLNPYVRIIDKVYFPEEHSWEHETYGIGTYLQEGLRNQREVKGDGVCFDNYAAHLEFYVHALNDKGKNVRFRDWTKLNAGEIVVASQGPVKDYIEQHYKWQVTYQKNFTRAYRILGPAQ